MYWSSDTNLAYGDGTNLDCYKVMVTTGDFGIAIITLGSHYSTLPCQPAPLEVMSVSCGRRAYSGVSCILSLPCHIKVYESLPHYNARPKHQPELDPSMDLARVAYGRGSNTPCFSSRLL
jgi:hypothetical protein